VVLQEVDGCWNAAVAECQHRRPRHSSRTGIQWSAAVQTPVNYHRQLEEHPIGDVKPMKLVVQYLTLAAVKPSAGKCNAAACSLQAGATYERRPVLDLS